MYDQNTKEVREKIVVSLTPSEISVLEKVVKVANITHAPSLTHTFCSSRIARKQTGRSWKCWGTPTSRSPTCANGIISGVVLKQCFKARPTLGNPRK